MAFVPAMAALAIVVILSQPRQTEVMINPEPTVSETPETTEVIATPKPTPPFDETKQILSLSLKTTSMGADGSGMGINDYEDDGIASLPKFETMLVLRRIQHEYNDELAKNAVQRAAALLAQTDGRIIENAGCYSILNDVYHLSADSEYLNIFSLQSDDWEDADEELVKEKAWAFLDAYRELFPFVSPELYIQKGHATVFEYSDDERQAYFNRMNAAGISVNATGMIWRVTIPLHAESSFEEVEEYPIIGYDQALVCLKARKSYPQTLEADPEIVHVPLGYFTDTDQNLMYPAYTFALPQRNPYFRWDTTEYRVVAIDERYCRIEYPEAVIVRKTKVNEEDELYQKALAAVEIFNGKEPKVEEAYYLKDGETVEYIVFNLLEGGKKTSAIVLGNNPNVLHSGLETRTQYDYYEYGEPFILYYR